MNFIAILVGVSAVFGFVQSTAVENMRDYRSMGHIKDAENNSEAICEAAGQICNNCNEVVICVDSEDEFIKVPVETCAADESCLAGQCTADRNPLCEADVDFICNNIGVFPDPYKCQTYHFCVADTNGDLLDYETQCDGSYGYHAGTTFCETKLEDNVCFQDINQFPVDLCLYSGQTAALTQNPSIYYICAKHTTEDVLYPYQYVCPHGGTYSNYQCNY